MIVLQYLVIIIASWFGLLFVTWSICYIGTKAVLAAWETFLKNKKLLTNKNK